MISSRLPRLQVILISANLAVGCLLGSLLGLRLSRDRHTVSLDSLQPNASHASGPSKDHLINGGAAPVQGDRGLPASISLKAPQRSTEAIVLGHPMSPSTNPNVVPQEVRSYLRQVESRTGIKLSDSEAEGLRKAITSSVLMLRAVDEKILEVSAGICQTSDPYIIRCVDPSQFRRELDGSIIVLTDSEYAEVRAIQRMSQSVIDACSKRIAEYIDSIPRTK